MKLIVGLGNPGQRYARTRHNLGYRVVDALAKTLATQWRADDEFHGELTRSEHAGTNCFLFKPNTFMNESGQAVQALAQYYHLTASDIWLVHDDLDIPFGQLKIKPFGSSAGHKGVQSVIEALGTSRLPRIKIGIRADAPIDQVTYHKLSGDAYVLESFTADQEKVVEQIIPTAVGVLTLALAHGLPAAMNQYN